MKYNRLTVRATYFPTKFGYCIGIVMVWDSNGNVIMDERNIFLQTKNFKKYLEKKFLKNKRFKVLRVWADGDEVVIDCEDLKGSI